MAKRVPIDEEKLKDAQLYVSLLYADLTNCGEKVVKLGKAAAGIDRIDARELGCYIPACNVRQGAGDIQMYIEVALMLLQNLKSDIGTMIKAREQFEENQKKEAARIKSQDRQKRYRERLKQKAAENK